MVPYDERMFREDVASIVERIPKHQFVGVYPIPRGGIALGVALSCHLNLPLISSKELVVGNSQGKILIADDLIDTGVTLSWYFDAGFDCAVLLRKPRSVFPASQLIFARSMPADSWIDFFWEKNDK